VTARPGSQGPAAGAPATKKLGKPEPSVAVAIRPSGRIAALRLELLPRPEHGGRILRAGKKSTVVHIDAALARADGTKVPIGFHFSDAREKERLYDNGREVFDLSRGWRTAFALGDARHAAVFELAAPLTLGAGEAIELRVKTDAVGAIRVSVSPFAGFGATAASPIAIPGAKRPTVSEALRGGGRRPVQELFVLSTAWDPATRGRLRALHRAELPLYEGRAPTLVTVAQPARPVRLLPRGNWQDDGGPLLEPGTPEFLPGAKPAPGRRLTRLDLARWLVSRDNPLTARVLVNRLWRQLFGAGLSGVLNDLGAQGEPPSYPELLDWLAAELMDSGWDVKRLVRLVVTSETYRQDSTARAKLVELDPGNRLLARQSQRRLDAEFVRDNALFVAGLLDPEIGGPSAFPYQPGGYYENLEFPRRDWIAATDARQYRRGLYVHWQRTFLHPMLANFDAPSREECTADRPPSNTPQQALTLLNDPSFVEAARAFAERLLTEGRAQDDGARIARAYEQALGRAPREVEQESLRKLLGAQREHYGSHPEDARKLLAVGLPRATNLDPAEHAAWTSVCRVVLNLYEAITRL
jgi:hypothetical protein